MNKAMPRRNDTKSLTINPMIRKISGLKETSDVHSTYAGVFGKCLYFMITICAGIILALYFNATNAMTIDPVTHEIMMSDLAIMIALGSLVVFLVMPLIAFIIRRTIPVTGALYCMAVGYLLTFMMLLDDEMGAYVLLALAFTLAIVIAMGVLFATGMITVDKKFRSVLTTLFSTMVIGSLFMVIGYFIPALRDSVMVLQDNLLISISASVLGVIVAAMFLLVDFNTIKETVDDRLPKKYEWYAAFGMVFTVVWLYFRILTLITKLQELKK